MSGVDTVRGINYQHCRALLVALEVAADSTLAGIRVEGAEDILDLELLTASPSDGSLVVMRGVQMKSRIAPYTWSKGELLEVFRRWADLPSSNSATFWFLTDGKMAASGAVVVAALDAARDGDLGLIAELLDVEPADPICEVARRVRIVSEPGSVEALLHSAEVEVRGRLTIGSRHPDAHRAAVDLVNELFRLISTRSGISNADDRFISRDHIVAVLGGASHLSATDRWDGPLCGEYTAVVAGLQIPGEVLPAVQASWQNEALRIDDLANISTPLVLAGRTGSGKSTLARLWRNRSAMDGRAVVVCQAEAYVAHGLDRLVADAVGEMVGRDLPRAVGRQTLADSSSLLILDGVSEVPPHLRDAVAEELRVHLAGSRRAKVVLVGRDETVCASVYPSAAIIDRLFPQSFDHEQRMELTARVLARKAETQDATVSAIAMAELAAQEAAFGNSDDLANDEFARECATSLAQVEHALGDAAGNPMLLRLALELVVDGIPFTDRASVYAGSIERMAARTNAGDVRIASATLGVVFAKLLDQGRRYANPLEWERLFAEAVSLLEERGVATEVAQIREAVARSGLVNATVVGIGATKLRGPVHDSFADYFAARAHADGLVPLPLEPVENDENRILISAQMSMLDEADVMRVAKHLPFTLVRLSESDNKPLTANTPSLVASILDAVLPASESVGVVMWRRKDGTPIAQAGTATSCWVAYDQAPDLFAGTSVVIDDGDGPVSIAVRLWRLMLNQKLERSGGLGPHAARSREEACEQLIEHVNQVAAAIKTILLEVAPPSAVDRLTKAVGPTGMTGFVFERKSQELGPDGWEVRFRRSTETALLPAPDDGSAAEEVHEDGDLTGSGDVESWVSTAPELAAAKQVGDAIMKLTRSHWL